MKPRTETLFVAPCGINCRLCRAYIRDKKACPGCWGEDSIKSKSCVTCRIKNCEMRLEGKITFCIECTEFSCERLNHLDKRYRTRYGTSPINNLVTIKKIGITNFVNAEEQKWTCPGCGAMLCMHKPVCLSCGYGWLVKIDSIP